MLTCNLVFWSDRAEFPLQWLGECLIHQSILYEGNPDRTNIRERFLYQFEDPTPPEETTAERAPSEATETLQEVLPQTLPEIMTSEVIETNVEPSSAPPASPAPPSAPQESVPQAVPTDAPVTNGIKVEAETKEQDVSGDEDTEMGGTT
jgi:hypothetical protein